MLRNVLFFCTYNGAERHVTGERFENASSRAKTNVILTSPNYVSYCAHYWWWRQFLTAPECPYVKPQSQCINSTWITLLMHGFLPIKTWLVVYDTAFIERSLGSDFIEIGIITGEMLVCLEITWRWQEDNLGYSEYGVENNLHDRPIFIQTNRVPLLLTQ